APGYAKLAYPWLVGRGQSSNLAIQLLPARAAPDGFVYVPSGRFLYGSADDDRVRREFLSAVPIHGLETGAYLIAQHETTVGEWIESLEALPPAERRRRMPSASSLVGKLRLEPSASAGWRFWFALTTSSSARIGEPFRYAGRTHRALQNWMRFPV